MSRIHLQNVSRASGESTDSLYAQLRNLMSDLQAQLNNYPNLYSRNDLKVPQGTRNRDVFVSLVKGVIRVGVHDGKRVRYLSADDLQVMQKHNTNFVGFKEDTTAVGAAATRTTHFPNPGDWGFYREIGVSFSIFYNFNNTSQFAAM